MLYAAQKIQLIKAHILFPASFFSVASPDSEVIEPKIDSFDLIANRFKATKQHLIIFG